MFTVFIISVNVDFVTMPYVGVVRGGCVARRKCPARPRAAGSAGRLLTAGGTVGLPGVNRSDMSGAKQFARRVLVVLPC